MNKTPTRGAAATAKSRSNSNLNVGACRRFRRDAVPAWRTLQLSDRMDPNVRSRSLAGHWIRRWNIQPADMAR